MNILLKPVITEKATADSELKNRFTFLVDTNANKVQIKKAVEETYGVSVDKVRTMVLTLSTETPYVSSTAFFIWTLFALVSTKKVNLFFSSLSAVAFSVITGLSKIFILT